MVDKNDMNSDLKMLLTFLESDPENLSLLTDCAEAAINHGEYHVANEVLEKYLAVDSFTPRQAGLSGLLALKEKRYEDAVQTYDFLANSLEEEDPAIQFNLALSLIHI